MKQAALYLAVALALVAGARLGVALTERGAEKAATQPTVGKSEPSPHRNPPRSVRPILNIPRLHLRVLVGTNLDRGPAWWPITGRPGGGDTIAIAGHRTTHTRPFRYLDRLRPGDAVWVSGVRYTVTGRRILSSKNLHIADAVGHERLLLTACHPLFSAKQRIVIYARKGE